MDETGPYYTMELLDGGDLRERSPVPWREACSLLFDVCSSLALLHSRRLVHRDVSPRNVRCTQHGSAKLIDFGAMVPMGQGGQIVGTPPFVAPEVVHRSTVDARTDLFSLGATLYYALTGRPAYPARELGQLFEAWGCKPQPPSALVPGIPSSLDGLVMSLIALEPILRPASAFAGRPVARGAAGCRAAKGRWRCRTRPCSGRCTRRRWPTMLKLGRARGSRASRTLALRGPPCRPCCSAGSCTSASTIHC